jgi:hypothetical protein
MGKIQLLPVPHFLQELTIKADLNGITVLNEGRYRKRYTGSKQFAVDINGNLHRAADLQRILKPVEEKKAPRKTVSSGKFLAPVDTAAVPAVKPEKRYSVNKPEIRRRIFAQIAAQRGTRNQKELYFWTVTFPLKTSDRVVYKLFNTWMTTIRTGYKGKKWLREYLWVVERQPIGTLHFHIAIPHKMSVVQANRSMQTILANAGKRGEIDYTKHQAKRYNGVDIAKNLKTRKVTNFAAGKRGARSLVSYITKYITKNDGTFSHLAWHNSRGFSALFTGITFTRAEFRHGYKFSSFVRPVAAVKNDFFTFWPWKNGPPPSIEGELAKINCFINDLLNL